MLGASRPRSDCRPSAQAPLPVMAVTASSGVSPEAVAAATSRLPSSRTSAENARRAFSDRTAATPARGSSASETASVPLRHFADVGRQRRGTAGGLGGDGREQARLRGIGRSPGRHGGAVRRRGSRDAGGEHEPQPSPARVARLQQRRTQCGLDEPGQDRLPGAVDPFGVGRRLDLAADGADPSAGDDDRAGERLVAGAVDDARADDGDGRTRLCLRPRRPERARRDGGDGQSEPAGHPGQRASVSHDAHCT